jgi:hypothetical protein
MKDQLGIIWEKQELISTNLSKDAVEYLADRKNLEIYPGRSGYYKLV